VAAASGIVSAKEALQKPTAMRAPFLMEPHTGSATIFFGTIFVVVAVGEFIPLLFGKETVGQPETVSEATPALA